MTQDESYCKYYTNHPYHSTASSDMLNYLFGKYEKYNLNKKSISD